jgi:hypothetical protein
MDDEVNYWPREHGVICVSCPECAFTFDAAHRSRDGGYDCPACAELRLEEELAVRRAAYSALMDEAVEASMRWAEELAEKSAEVDAKSEIGHAVADAWMIEAHRLLAERDAARRGTVDVERYWQVVEQLTRTEAESAIYRKALEQCALSPDGFGRIALTALSKGNPDD